MAGNLIIKVVKVPAWMTKGINLGPYLDDAIGSVSNEIESRQGKGKGAKRNFVTTQRGFLQARVFTTLHFPRTTGSAMQRNQEGRFRGMAPRAIKKYVVTPLEAEWAASQ